MLVSQVDSITKFIKEIKAISIYFMIQSRNCLREIHQDSI
jgi:hypothetical protein